MIKDLLKFRWFMFVLLIIASLTLISCSSAKTTVAPAATQKPAAATTATLTPKSGGVLRVVPRNPTQSFGYGVDFSQAGSLELSYPCVESICGVDSKGNFLPRLATGYQVASDGKSITFTLRKGVKFNDGTDFNAQAAKWNLEILKKARIVGTESWVSLPSLDVVDDYTVRINLKQYTNTLIYQLASNCSRMISPTSVEKNGENWAHTNIVGTGPFKFASFTPDVGIKYERNDGYWGEKAYLDGIEFIYIKDDMAKSAALQSGAVDLLFNVTSETAIALRSKGYYANFGKQSVLGLLPDSVNADSPLSNLKVREAVEYAVDRDALAKLGNGFWEAANQPTAATTPGYITNFEGRKYDPEKAKLLLTQAGYPDGIQLNLVYTTNMLSGDGAVAVQQFLSKAGITLTLEQTTANQRTDYTMNGWKNGFVAFSVYPGLDYLSALQYNLGGPLAISTVRPPGFIDLLTQAVAATDAATTETLTRKIVTLLYDDATVIPLWVYPKDIYVIPSYVHDAGIYENGGIVDWNPEKTWLSK